MKFLYYFALFLVLFSCSKSDSLFTTLSDSETGIEFKNELLEKKAFGILYYLYYFNGGGVSVGDINNDGLQDVYFTANNKSGNKLYLNKGNFKFEDITTSSGVAGTADWCTGTTMADVNGDGLLDIYVASVNNMHDLSGANQLFINQGNNKFVDKAEEFGLNFSGYSTQAAFFDYDHDGDLDCYLLNQSLQPNQNIRPAKGRAEFDANAGDRFYRNENGKKFIDISKQAGILQSNLGYGLGISVADFNNDGFEDVYIGNDFHENDYYYLNDGKGAFIESGEKHFEHYSRFSMGNDAGDYNNDGQLDLITVDMLPDNEKTLKTYGSDESADSYQYKIISNGYQYQYSRNCLQNNNGNGQSFSEVGLLAGISATDWSWCPLFADFDNDSNKDLYISSGIVKRPVDLDYVKYVSNLMMSKGLDQTDKYDKDALDKMPDGASHPFLFQGNGNGIFADVSKRWGTATKKGYFNGSAYADLDNDGDLDLVINSIGEKATVLKNNSKNNFVTINFKGENLNTNGLGAKAYVFADQKMQFQQLEATHGFQSSSEQNLYFGLGESKNLDSILVVWPNQKYQIIKNVKVNSRVTVHKKEAQINFDYAKYFKRKNSIIQNFSAGAGRNHIENFYNDFSAQPLLPHKMSTRGPKIAVGDLNNDSFEDFFVCGALGQKGAVMLQNANGSFNEKPNAEFNTLHEQVGAVIFDANQDKINDILVISGGNESKSGSENLNDELFINTGNGTFKKAMGFPKISLNKGAVSHADIDNDGDQDIFIGTLGETGKYGIIADSYLLLNDGKGNFTISDQSVFKDLGMVTDAKFADLNQDGFNDLVVVGEFMPITIFENKKGEFVKTEIKESAGLWQSVVVDDVDSDGKLDILAGNWGLNNKFSSLKDGIVKMYASDFDKNGIVDQLISYQIDGKEYPFLAKDEVERPMPVLKQHYKLYADFAGLEMKDAYYGFAEQVKPLTADNLASKVAYQNASGGFDLKNLPIELQKAPLFGFQKINKNTFICGGNFFDVSPYEGRYDAQPLALFTIASKKISYLHQADLYSFKGQVRDIKSVKNKAGKNLILVAFNNGPIEFFRVN